MADILANIKVALDEFGENVLKLMRASIEKNGVNKKTGTNTLVDSNLFKEMNISHDEWGLYSFMINDYSYYVEQGRLSKEKKPKQKLPPISAIAEWASRKNITNDNKVVWAIAQAIVRDGIPPRPFIQEGFDALDEYWEGWSDRIFNILTENLDEFFNN